MSRGRDTGAVRFAWCRSRGVLSRVAGTATSSGSVRPSASRPLTRCCSASGSRAVRRVAAQSSDGDAVAEAAAGL